MGHEGREDKWWTVEAAQMLSANSLAIVKAKLQANNHIPLWWAGEHPPDLEIGCNICMFCISRISIHRPRSGRVRW